MPSVAKKSAPKKKPAAKKSTHKGGSIASDAVIRSVDSRAFSAMNQQATNQFPGMKGGAQSFAALFGKNAKKSLGGQYTIFHQSLKGGATTAAPPVKIPAASSSGVPARNVASLPVGVNAGISKVSDIVRYPASLSPPMSAAFHVGGAQKKPKTKTKTKTTKKKSPTKKSSTKLALPSVNKLKNIQRSIQSIFGK